MPTFDIVSKVDQAEVRNAVDQARRELTTRFDFKNTDSSIDHTELEHARWFTRAEIAAALAGEADATFDPPPPHAIARTLLEAWAEE